MAYPLELHVEALTSREHQMAAAVAKGLRNRQIATEFGISEETVKKHLATIYDKLDLSGRVELAIHVLRHGEPRAVTDGAGAGRVAASL